MTEPRQRSIGVTPKEKIMLEEAKKRYEKLTGNKTDWGKFLGVMAIGGLAALGVYKIIKSNRANPEVTCAICGKTFSIAYSDNLPPMVYIQCPHCQEQLVVNITQQ